MSYRQILPSHSQTKDFRLSFQPAEAWVAIIAFMLFSTLCILIGAGRILNLAFPVGAVAVGVLLYIRAPLLYVGFTWWVWLLAPLVRRLADYRSGFTDPSPILLAPYLVTLITLITLWRYLPKTHRQGSFPLVLSLLGVIYGFLVGLIYRSPTLVVIDLLDWLVPILFSFHLFAHWRDYPSYRQTIQRTLLWGVLITGTYGVIQYLTAPEWDRFWLINADINSQGIPEPLGLRVWSTMNSSEPFSAFMAAGLLLLFSNTGALRLPASVAGYLAFLLTLVRSAWLGWFAGLLILANSLRANLQMRLVITVLMIAMLIVPLATIEPFSQVINDRIETLSDVENDGSANIRKATYRRYLNDALTSFMGQGIGGESYDSAVLSTLFNLGWLGTSFYAGGMLLLVISVFQGNESSFDPFVGAARAIVVSALVRLPVNIPMLGVSGLILWGFLGIGMAAKKYYKHQHTTEHEGAL